MDPSFGSMLRGGVISYPSCLILFLVGIIFLLYLHEKRDCLLFAAACLCLGIGYLCLVMQNVSIHELSVFLQGMFSLETAHSAGLLEKGAAYLKDGLVILAVFAVFYIISHLAAGVISRKCMSGRYGKILTDALFCGFILFISLYTVIFWQDYIRYSYSLIFPAFIFVGTHYVKKLSPDLRCFYMLGTVISLFQFMATLLLTNLNLLASVPYMLIGFVVSMLPLSAEVGAVDKKGLQRKLKTVFLFCTVIFLAGRNAYMIRPLYGEDMTVRGIAGIVKSGPAMGVITEYMGAYMQNETMKEWAQYIHDGDAIYLIGYPMDTLGYLYADTTIAAPSLTSTPGYNESILDYWEMNPEKYPDVIIASCWYGVENSMLTEDSWIMQWIEQEYRPQYVIDGKYWRYYFK